MKSLFDSFIDFNQSLNTVQPLAAIWLEKPVQTENERTVRITIGHKVYVNNGRIEDVSKDNPATHEVKGCYGNISDTVLYFELMDLKTNELLTLKIK